jgi:hypothetical protein
VVGAASFQPVAIFLQEIFGGHQARVQTAREFQSARRVCE